VDPNAGQPNQSVDPNAVDPNQLVEPNAGQPNQSGDPNAADPNRPVDPNAGQPNQSVDPNAVDPNQSIDPNAADPNATIVPVVAADIPASASTVNAGPPLPATDVDLFFERDSADLTASDKAALDAYAQAVIKAASTDRITVEAYASMEGVAQHNQQLSADRAKAVVDYLVTSGVPALQISPPAGRGPTDRFSKDDPRANRRATIAPKAPSSSTPATPASPSPPPGSPSKPPNPADPPPPQQQQQEVKEEHKLPALTPIAIEKPKPHAGGDLAAGYPWSLQATLVLKDWNLKQYGDPSKLSLDLFHEPNLSLTLDPNSGLTSQEMIALLNLHWIPPWRKEIEVPLNIFLNQHLTKNPGHASGGAQVQVEQHITDWFSLTVNVSGTIGEDKIFGAGGGVLFHWDPKKK
jgi:outer membrane protein OmpA-like peptidoglycan-associated protein